MDKDTSAQSACVSNDLLRRMVCGCNRSEIDVREAVDCEGRSKNCGYGKWGLEITLLLPFFHHFRIL